MDEKNKTEHESSGGVGQDSVPGLKKESGLDPDPWTDAPVETSTAAQAGSPESPKTGKSDPVSESRVDLSGENWERDVLNRLAFATLNEQRRARRWSVFFKLLLFIYFGAVLFYVPGSDWGEVELAGGKHTALIDIEGVIAANSTANADSIISGLRSAFKNKNTVAIILRINSPGGSPVQAGYVYDEIRRLRAKYGAIKLYAVITDMCASGGYYIAAAADEIYADKASIVGSIGVLMDGFGFVDAMQKLGVERRLLTAGEHKGILDPFSPIKKDEQNHVQSLLDGVHQQFIDVVKQGRGGRLKESPQLFSGLFWNGEEGVKLGLVDGLGSSGYVAREIIGVEKIVDFTERVSYLDRFADRIGAAMANVLASGIGMKLSGLR
jgi:protease-4